MCQTKGASALFRGRTAKTATSCGNAVLTPILWASDRHKTNHAGNPDVWSDLAYDPRGWALELDSAKFVQSYTQSEIL
jgi:hypothetical protein